ncbi:MAG: DUF3782 domain-containing protein [bacterium]|nr:DUF3782 domain-containing protein [bacterium]
MVENTFDEIRRILAETTQRQNNVAREQEIFHKQFIEEMRQLHASQEEIQASQKELQASQKKTDEQLKETDEQLKETDKQLKKTAKEVGGIGGGLGRAAEGLTAPAVPKVFKKLGIKVEAVHQRVKALHDGQVKAEIDLLCPARRNGSSLILVGEVKAHLTNEDVKDFLDESLISFKKNFAEYKDREVIAFVAGLNVQENALRFAQKKGLYVLVPFGETMRLANAKDFEPKVW